MRYSKFLLFTIALICLSFQAYGQMELGGMGSSGDWLSPDINRIGFKGDSGDSRISGMVQWLDRPVPTFPWYSSDVAFYTEEIPDTTFSPYQEYYTRTWYYETEGTPVPMTGGIVSDPAEFDIATEAPSNVYYGAGLGLPYSQYLSLAPSLTNDLWIRGEMNWTQYVVSPVGTYLQLVADVPIGGHAGFYEVIQGDTTAPRYKTYQFSEGYNTMDFYADEVGRHMLYFVVNNQPSNVVIVDVFTPETSGSMPPA